MAAKTVAFHTLGCKLNYSETSTLSRLLAQDGYEKKEFTEAADVYVINTCSVTNNADKECRQLVRRVTKQAPNSTVVITGCYAQLQSEAIATIPGVDLVIGAAEKFNIVQHINNYVKSDKAQICSCDISEVTNFVSSYSVTDRTRTFLKLQDGCNYTCAFCTIPQARGKSRSDSPTNVLANVTSIAAQGVKEIVLTGVNLGDYNYEGINFYNLIQQLDAVDGIARFRISSIEPNLLSNDIISFVATSKKFMPHFHIPLQSGSNTMLGLMRRRYVQGLYTQRVQAIKQAMPHCCIGVDVIVGHPGETDELFMETYNYLHQLEVSYLHVFTYSERPNTRHWKYYQ